MSFSRCFSLWVFGYILYVWSKVKPFTRKGGLANFYSMLKVKEEGEREREVVDCCSGLTYV